jgi:hypothetical protein
MIVVLLAISADVYPCSIFKYSVDGRTYFCGNEDWTAKDPAIQTYKANGKQYGYVLFGWGTYLPRYAQAGVNSEGLCFDWAAVPTQVYIRDNKKPDASLDVTVDILKNCKSIDEVIKYIDGYNVPHIAEEHIMFTDKAGKSCVIEYNHSKQELVHDHAAFQFITNFHLTDPALGWYPCERYRKMAAFFGEDGSKEHRLAEILHKVHQEGQYPTIYSYIFDLGRMEITVFYNHNYMTKRVYAFSKLVEANVTIDISSSMKLGGE